MSSAAVEALLDVLRLHHHAAEPRPGRDLDLRLADLLASGLLGELLVGLDARLGLGLPRLGRGPDPFQLALHGPLLAPPPRGSPRGALGLLLQPARVVALVGHALAAIELQRPLGDTVQEVAVVGDEDHAARVLFEVMLQPSHGLGVEMVGRLVEQQNVGLRQQQLRQRHAPLLAARELLSLRMRRRAAQRVERLLHLGVEVPQVLPVDHVLQLGHLVGGLVGIVHGKLVVAVEHGLLLRHALHGVAEHVLRLVELRLLRQIADATPSAAQASPWCSFSTPAMIFSSVDLPEPFTPTTPIFASGRNDSEMFFSTCLPPG